MRHPGIDQAVIEQEQASRLGTLHLAAGGLGNTARWHHPHPGRQHSGPLAHCDAHRPAQRVVLCCVRAGFDNEVQFLRQTRGIGVTDGRDTAEPDTRHLLGRDLEIGGQVIRAPDDDQILVSAGDPQSAVAQVPDIAGVPPAIAGGRLGRLGQAEIADRGRRAAELDASDDVVAARDRIRVDDSHLGPVHRRAAIHDLHRIRVTDRNIQRHTASGQCFARHRVEGHRRVRAGDGDREGCFGHAVARHQCVLRQPPCHEAVHEVLHGRRVNRLRATEQESPAGQIHLGQFRIRHPCRCIAVGEIRCGSEGSPIASDRPQPVPRAAQESARRHQNCVEATEHRCQEAADESHVVMQRQPAHPGVAATHCRSRGDLLAIGSHVAVRDLHPLWCARRTRGRLNERQIAGGRQPRGQRGRIRCAGQCVQHCTVDRGHGVRHRCGVQHCHARHDRRRFQIAEQAGELVQENVCRAEATRRGDGRGYRTEQQRTEERGDELG